MAISRRSLMKTAVAASGLMVMRPFGVLAETLPSIDAWGTLRESRLFPGEFVVHADMHNHSNASDGAGSPEFYYETIRSNGLDAAALTDHTSFSQGMPMSFCGDREHGTENACQSLAGMNDASWEEIGLLADAADTPGQFTAIRGFEWSSPTLGHMNCWFSGAYTDPAHTGGLGTPADLSRFFGQEFVNQWADEFDAILAETPAAGRGMAAWYEWLKADPSMTGIGGADGIFGFNHPGREPGRFSDFAFDPALVERAVSVEMFNKGSDFLFELVDEGRQSPLSACLDAGWKPGILGVSDYHDTDWGAPDDRGRSGMYISAGEGLSRDTIRSAMEARRFFATSDKGLRLDATANGARMGQTLGHTSGDMTFRLDIDRGAAWHGKTLNVQILMTGSAQPTLVDSVEITVPSPQQPVVQFTRPIDIADGEWVVLRVTDPERGDRGGQTEEYNGLGRSIAYSSPFYLDADAPTSAAFDGAIHRDLEGRTGARSAGAIAAAGVLAARETTAHQH